MIDLYFGIKPECLVERIDDSNPNPRVRIWKYRFINRPEERPHIARFPTSCGEAEARRGLKLQGVTGIQLWPGLPDWPEPTFLYGRCPICMGPGISRERRPNGNDTCHRGHNYPSSSAIIKS